MANIIRGTNSDDILEGLVGLDNIIYGRRGNDIIFGNDQNDTLHGGKGNDTFRAHAGNDIIKGGGGNDLAYHNVTENFGFTDSYDGGGGFDTLALELTGAQLTELLTVSPNIVNDFSTNFDFSTLGLSYDFDLVSTKFEELQLPVVTLDDDFVSEKNDEVTGNVLADNGNGADFDPNGDTITVVAEASSPTAQGGTVTLNSDGSFVYNPVQGFFGTDNFTYTVTDAVELTSTGTVTIEVNEIDFLGFKLVGINQFDLSAFPASSAGDINGDGFDDILIGASRADPNGSSSGQSYVVFGGQNFASLVDANGAISLSSLDGTNGFMLNGISADDGSGNSVSSIGDINGDNIDDIIIGARDADPNGLSSGQSYVVFGGQNFAGMVDANGAIELSSLDGMNGFKINGVAAGDGSGGFVGSAGDINNDGFDDITISAINADPNGESSGQSYVVFGGQNFASLVDANGAIELSNLDGTNGFKLNGITAFERSGYNFGSAGDINNDGIDDLILGAVDADPNGTSSGQTYVLFGGQNFASLVDANGALELSSLDGTNGFKLNGINPYEFSGHSVDSAGDVNGDGIGDIIISAWGAGSGTAGQSYVVFGGQNFASLVDTNGAIELNDLDGSNGFKLNGNSLDRSGLSASSAGDINDDGFADIIIGAPGSNLDGFFVGQAYVVFGNQDFSSLVDANGAIELSSLDGTNGFKLNGANDDDTLGYSVNPGGDINGDGIDDILVGAPESITGWYLATEPGTTYVIYGGQDFASLVDANGAIEVATLGVV